ncbi:MAG TPA: DNA topoisomerase IB [Nocardioides sp.]|nr:DNA topoisomerase IB [Nocardioides sp.]
MPRTRRSSPDQPGWTRRRAGRGFVYLDEHGERLADEDAQRVRDLVIPPAWQDVWICPWPNGHLQAVGTDDAGRRQYLYHPDWRARRDSEKFDRVLHFGRALSRAREQVLTDLGTEGMTLPRASATAVRLLDLGYFRIGNDVYADQNGSFGLTTLERRHVRRHRNRLLFSFEGKSGIEHRIEIDDPGAIEALDVMRRRRGGGERLLAWKDGRRWQQLDSGRVNEYVRETTGLEATAKDFRTWHATVIAAAALADTDEPGESKASRKRAVSGAMKEVAEFLGNTPALARSSYVDPRVIDAYDEGRTIAATTRRTYAKADERQAAYERAVLRLLKNS